MQPKCLIRSYCDPDDRRPGIVYRLTLQQHFAFYHRALLLSHLSFIFLLRGFKSKSVFQIEIQASSPSFVFWTTLYTQYAYFSLVQVLRYCYFSMGSLQWYDFKKLTPSITQADQRIR